MPTLDHVCGGECAVLSGGSSHGLTKHWDFALATGGAITAVTTPVRSDGRAIKFEATGSGDVHLQRLPSSETTRVWRFGLYFETLPSADAVLLRYVTAAGRDLQLRYLTASEEIQLAWDTTATGFTAVSVTTGVWYLVEIKVDVSANPFTATWQVDGADKGTGTNAQTATTCSQWRIGIKCASETFTIGSVLIDDLITGPTLGDYPYGDGQVVGLFPTGDGTHNASAAGDFEYEDTSDVDPGATDTYQHINDPAADPNAVYLAAVLAGTGEYLEWLFSGMPAASVINGLTVTSLHFAASTTTNLQSLRLIDGATTEDVIADGDFSQTSICVHGKTYAVSPNTSAAWTQTGINALKARWGSSWTAADVNPDAYLARLVLEVDYVPAAATAGAGPLVNGDRLKSLVHGALAR